jgi:hypothetical protein
MSPKISKGRSQIKAAQYNTLSKYNIRLGKSAGLESPFRWYTLRRGAGNAINSMNLQQDFARETLLMLLEHATEPERMQAMGHVDPNLFRRHYLNQILTVDTLACFLGTPSRAGVMKLASHMSLTRDTKAPTALSEHQKNELRANPILRAAQMRRDTMKADLIDKYRSLKLTKELDPVAHTELVKLTKSIHATEAQLRRTMLAEARENFFATAGARYIEEQQMQQNNAPTEALASKTINLPRFELEERNRVRDLLFTRQVDSKNQETSSDEPSDGLSDVIGALRALCLRTSRPSEPSEVVIECLEEEEIPHKEVFLEAYPVVVPGTVCLFCLGTVSLPTSARTHAYAHRSTLARHVEDKHLKLLKSNFTCPHPTCSEEGVWLRDSMHFKNHAAIVHNVYH